MNKKIFRCVTYTDLEFKYYDADINMFINVVRLRINVISFNSLLTYRNKIIKNLFISQMLSREDLIKIFILQIYENLDMLYITKKSEFKSLKNKPVFIERLQ